MVAKRLGYLRKVGAGTVFLMFIGNLLYYTPSPQFDSWLNDCDIKLQFPNLLNYRKKFSGKVISSVPVERLFFIAFNAVFTSVSAMFSMLSHAMGTCSLGTSSFNIVSKLSFQTLTFLLIHFTQSRRKLSF